MRKTLAAGVAAITFGGAIATAALPSVAAAQSWRGDHGWRGGHRGDWGRHRDRDNTGAAIIAGIAGLAIGAALASSGNRHDRYGDYGYGRRGYGYDRGYGYRYDRGYGYGRGYAYGYPQYGYSPYSHGYAAPYAHGGYGAYGYGRPRACVSRHWVWDPYLGHRVPVTRRHAC